jgi:hypothetical protein
VKENIWGGESPYGPVKTALAATPE